LIPLLPEASRPELLKLTFEELFTTKKGYELAKELVKAIVNRNIAKGSNVETIAEALRRKCGSFCSPDDVVIFKAQEQLKRATEAGGNVEFSRNLLNESLKLFEQVAHSLPNDYLQSAVKQYTDLQFFAGAIQLALQVAHEKDKANEALSWMNEGRPESDARKVKFDLRSRCYDLIHDVVIAADRVAEQGPSFVDGRPTLAATRRNEAYDVISKSKDEAFLTNLYDWYLQQGWNDRLLATDSSFIVTYLQRKSSEDIAYADLLWKYYGQTSQFSEAAKIQLQLARSPFSLSLEKRIEYLGRAKANASTYTLGGNRKTKQQLLQEISELLDIATVQDEILQRLKDDPRLGPERRQDVLDQVNGAILDINTLFNNYADNAGYYDLCLLIYQLADHRDASQIKQTWQQLLQSVHDKTTEDGQIQPFEAIAEQVRSLGSKLRVSETTFPVHTLLPILERYSFEHQRTVSPPHWVVDIFLDLEISYERLFEVLETMFVSGDAPFLGSNRKYLGSELAYVVSKWFHDSMRAGTPIFGSQAGAMHVNETMEVLLQQGKAAGLDDETMSLCRSVVERIGLLG
jgi:nuclear pore complex protein Nup155